MFALPLNTLNNTKRGAKAQRNTKDFVAEKRVKGGCAEMIIPVHVIVTVAPTFEPLNF